MSCRWNSHDRKTYIWLRTYRSLIFVPHGSKSGMLLFISSHIEKETWSQLLSLVPRFKGSRIALPVETSNADQPHEMYIYSNTRWRLGTIVAVHHQRGVYLHTPYKGHFPLLCSWQIVLNLRDSWIVKTKASRKRLFQYVLPCPLASGRTRQPFICSNSFAPWWALGVYVMRSYSV